MDLLLTEKQLKLILSKEIKEADAPPESGGNSTTTSGGGNGSYPAVSKWESGVSRGPSNQIAVTKWADIVGSSLKRDKGNPLN